MNTQDILEIESDLSLIQTAIHKYESGKLDEAETIYKQILQTKSQDHLSNNLRSQVMLNLGNVLHKQGKLTEAIKLYQEILELFPNFADAHNDLGNVFLDLGRFRAAIDCYQQTLSINPNHVYAHNNLGNALRKFDLEAAINCYQKAVSIKPDYANAYYNLGTALYEQGQLEASLASYQQALNIQPGYDKARFSLCMNQLPIIYRSFDEIESRRHNYQQHLLSLAHHYELAPVNSQVAAEVVGYLQPFYLAYQGFNDRVLQQSYGKMICQLMASRYPQWCQSIELPKLTAKEKVRVGVVTGFFREHSCWKLIKGWVKNLDRSEFELFGYHTGSIQDQETVKATKAFDEFTQGPLLVEQWAKAIVQDKLDVLIFPEFGMDPMSVCLGCLRLAPIQIASWIHPETSGMPTIDYFLTSDLMEPENAQEHYTEQLVRLPNLSIYYTPLEVELEAISKSDIGIASDEIMFWCCQALYKYLPQHDDIFPRIAKALEKCKFVFIKHHSGELVTEVFRERLRCAFEEYKLNYQDYCVFLQPMDIKRFSGTAAIADVFLDSIGWSGGNTTLETIAHNIPVVTLPCDLMRGRHSMAILKMMGIEETIACSKEDYVQIAVRLGQNAQYRQNISRQIAENKHKLYGDLKPVRALEDFLLKVFNKPRRNTKEVKSILELANQHQRAYDYASAEQLYRQVLEKQPDHPEALYGLGTLAIQMEQPQIAERWLSAASQVQPSVKIWFSLGNVCFSQGKWSQAQEAYEQAIILKPDAAPLYNNLGYTLQQQGLLDKAIAYYQKALELQPNFFEVQVNLGNLLHTQGKLSVEQKAYYAQLNYKLGTTKKQAGDLQTAISCYQQAILLQPDFVNTYNDLGAALQAQGKFEEAKESYQKALELQPECAEAFNNLGTLLEQQGELQQALQSYQKAFQLQPEYAQAYSNILNVAYKLNSANIWERFRKIWQTSGTLGLLIDVWQFFWMTFAGNGFFGRIATWFATWFTPPYWGRCQLARYHEHGYISQKAAVYHQNLQLGANVFIGDRVTIYQDHNGGKVELGARVHLYGDTYIQTGKQGELIIGADTHIQPRCHFCAYEVPIQIGSNVLIAPNCTFFPYDHAMAKGQLIHLQPLKSKGPIVIGDGAWLGCGVTVLQGVSIGKGAVVGAGSVVTHDIPDNAIAVGSPARVVKMRT